MVLIKKIVLLVFSFSLLMSIAHADNSIKIENAWSPEAPPVTKVMAGYMRITNLSDKNLKVKSIKSNLFKRVEIHLTQMKNGMMSMLKQEGLIIKAKDHVELKSGGLHMMLMGKLEPITKGAIIPVTLTFDNGEVIDVNLKVKSDSRPEMKCGAMMNHH